MAAFRLCLIIVLSLIAQSLQQDPIVDFCRRWGHRTAQINGRLYLDGGMAKYNQQQLNYTNNWLLFSDLQSPREGTGFPTQYSNLSKPQAVPSVSGGYIWADETNKCFYQFGGEYATGASPTDFSLWTYDTILDEWNTTKYTSTDRTLERVSFGAGTQVESSGLGFYYGGWLNERTTPGWSGPPLATSSIVRFDFSTGVLKNTSHPDGIGRAEGQMVYVPISDSGILIYFGGVEDPYHNGSHLAANMTDIHIYDIKSSKWYKQTATGNVPAQRRQFCADVTWVDDRSSFNIYLYGGYGFPDPLAFNEVYILSLPSFTWVKAYDLDPGAKSPDPAGHGGCTANVVNRDQMIVIGGWFPMQSDCDSPDTQGLHNMILGNNTAKGTMWDQYDAKLSKYAVPAAVVSAIGGGPTGGATVTAPATWDHVDLATYATLIPTFTPRSATRTFPSPTDTPRKSSNKTNVGAIAGGVVGGLVFLIILLSLILLCLRRRKKAARKTETHVEPRPQPPAELALTTVPQEMSTRTASKYISAHEAPVHDAYSNHSGVAPGHTQYLGHEEPLPHAASPHGLAPPYTPTAYQQPRDDHYSQRSPRQRSEAELFFPQAGSVHTTPPAIWDHQNNHAQSVAAAQRQYSYPTPTSPRQSPNAPTEQPQTYYPPPNQSPSHSHYAQPSFSDQGGSPTMTQYSGGSPHEQSPNTSTTATPAHFYPQATKSGTSELSAETRTPVNERPAHGRFMESGHM